MCMYDQKERNTISEERKGIKGGKEEQERKIDMNIIKVHKLHELKCHYKIYYMLQCRHAFKKYNTN